jgi:hypothetical protein
MTDLERLKSLCSDHSPMTSHVVNLRAADRRWLFATNGHAFLALRSDEGGEGEAPPAVKALANELIARAVVEPKTMRWQPLRDFMRYEAKVEDCDECLGTGRHECVECESEHDCGCCEGGKVTVQRPEPVRLLGATVNRAIFHRFAHDLDAERVRHFCDGKDSPLVFAHEDERWVLAVMPTRDKPVATFEVQP